MGRFRRPYAGNYSICLLLAGVGEMTVLLMAATAMVLALLYPFPHVFDLVQIIQPRRLLGHLREA
jgi:hypothetical protein